VYKKYLSPQPDITAPELCAILMKCNNFYIATQHGILFKTKEVFDELPSNIKRHFTDAPAPK
jgi:hypothetical protein